MLIMIRVIMSRFKKIPVFLWTILCSSFAFAADKAAFDNTLPKGESHDVIAFVGRKISFEEKNIPQITTIKMPDGRKIDRVIPSFDTRYEARYAVAGWVAGKSQSAIIDFKVYDHYGRPALPNIKNPLILLVNHEGKWIQSKYNNYNLSRTTDGDWAICGHPARHKRTKDEGLSYVQPLSFIDIVKSTEAEICKSGTRVRDIFHYQNTTRFQPEKRRVSCNLEIGIKPYFHAGTGSSPDAKLEGQKHDACMERLKFEALTNP